MEVSTEHEVIANASIPIADDATDAMPRQGASRWNLPTRIAFRFCVVYLSLYGLFVQLVGTLISIPKVDIPDLSSLPPLRPVVFWVAGHIFGLRLPLVYSGSGSGDKTYDWVMVLCFLMIAAVATVVWSVLDRKRLSYPRFHAWFRLFLRFGVAGQMLTYGIVKLFPLQMPYPSLTRLLEPYGNFSPMGVLWYSIGASPAYEMACGSAELLAGVLLLIPRTALLGALVTMGVTSEIFILNMTYDVPVKILSSHLLLMALFLAAPELSRVADFFLRDRAVGRSLQPSLFRTARANRFAVIAQMVFAVWLIGNVVYGAWSGWSEYGGGAPRSALSGIWTVDHLSIDGQERSPLLNDYGRWKRVVFDYPEYMSYQRMDDSFAGYGAAIDTKSQTIALTRSDDKKFKGSLHYQRPKPDQLVLDGDVGGHPMHMQLALMDRNQFTLVSRGFHWVQDYPFNR